MRIQTFFLTNISMATDSHANSLTYYTPLPFCIFRAHNMYDKAHFGSIFVIFLGHHPSHIFNHTAPPHTHCHTPSHYSRENYSHVSNIATREFSTLTTSSHQNETDNIYSSLTPTLRNSPSHHFITHSLSLVIYHMC